MSYDNRVRGTEAETDRHAALTRIRALTQAVLDLDPRLISRWLCLSVRLDARGTAIDVESSVGRELAFVISHTIHHHATIALLLSEIGTDLPNRFGVAASTPAPASSGAGATHASNTVSPLGLAAARTVTSPSPPSHVTVAGIAPCAP